jgi:hypothetical protein
VNRITVSEKDPFPGLTGQGVLSKEDNLEKKFKQKYLDGEIEFEAIDDYSYEWGMSDEECTLREYLGLNAEEEDAWITIGEEALLELLEKQKKR